MLVGVSVGTLKSSNKRRRGPPLKEDPILQTGLKTYLQTGWGPLFGKFQVDYEAKFQVSWKIPSPKKDMVLDMGKDMFLETFLGGGSLPLLLDFRVDDQIHTHQDHMLQVLEFRAHLSLLVV